MSRDPAPLLACFRRSPGRSQSTDTAASARISSHCPGVDAIHDLNIWGMSTTETALTCHLVMLGGHPADASRAAHRR
jgi:Co/Zn/Cd efflux system component